MAMSDQAVRTELMGENDPKTYENNYLVEAGAGAGKTYTMVQRIVNQLMNTDCAPQELVAITFTVKATQELEERLVEWIVMQCGPDVGRPDRGRLGFQVWLKNGVVSDTWARGQGCATVPAPGVRAPHPHPQLSAHLPSSPGRF